MPTCPLVFNPQPYSLLLVVIAKLCVPPVPMLIQDVNAGPLTKTGLLIGDVRELMPTCPLVFRPQPQRLPSVVNPIV